MDMYVYDNIGRMVEITETLEELEKLRIKYRNKNIGWRFLKACSLTFIVLGGTYGYFPYSFLGFIPLIIITVKSDKALDDYTLVLNKIERIKK
jgi:hypothetical protein